MRQIAVLPSLARQTADVSLELVNDHVIEHMGPDELTLVHGRPAGPVDSLRAAHTVLVTARASTFGGPTDGQLDDGRREHAAAWPAPMVATQLTQSNADRDRPDLRQPAAAHFGRHHLPGPGPISLHHDLTAFEAWRAASASRSPTSTAALRRADEPHLPATTMYAPPSNWSATPRRWPESNGGEQA